MEDEVRVNDELLDLVDENDRVIGEVWKSEANRRPGLIHREAQILIYDGARKLLLQQRALNKLVNPGFWAETCAGHVLEGEDTLAAAHRELLEELGFDTELKFVEKILVRGANETHFFNWFFGKYSGQLLKVDRSEVEQARFVGREEFQQMLETGSQFGPEAFEMINRFWAGEFDHLL